MTYIRCPQCGATALNVATMCPKCRTPLTQNPMQAGPHGLLPCRRCKKLIDRDTEICPFCAYQVRRGRAIRRTSGIVTILLIVLVGGGYGLMQAGGVAGIADWIARVTTPDALPPTYAPVPDAPRVVPDPMTPVTVAPPETTPRIPERQPVPALVVRYARGWANVRAGRDTASAVVAVLRPSELVRVATPIGGWWAVWRDSLPLGYVAADLLRTTLIPPDSLPALP